jgi:hypothetical protein
MSHADTHRDANAVVRADINRVGIITEAMRRR